MQTEWRGYKFTLKEGSKIRLEGYIDRDRILNFNPKLFHELKTTLKRIEGDPLKEKEYIRERISKGDIANFLFIRSIFDYGNIAPSWVFSQVLISIYEATPQLFRPMDKFWDSLLNKPKEQQRRIISLPLLKLAGLFRSSFKDLVRHWINIIVFIRDVCNGDASIFFEKMAEALGIDTKDECALEELHNSLKRKEIKKRAGIRFPYGDKNGRLLFSLMSKSSRGLDVLKGIKDEHLRNFNIPVDAQIIRVSLNTGFIRITWVDAEQLRFKESKKVGYGLAITRSDFTEPCQHLWKLIAQKLNIFPVDLDYYIWSLGSILCKRYGEFCYICPLKVVCWSWEKGSVAESRGVDWQEGCFSFGRAEPGIDRLILRTCKECPCYKIGLEMKKECVRDKSYRTRRTSD